jgi:hypothetical protein
MFRWNCPPHLFDSMVITTTNPGDALLRTAIGHKSIVNTALMHPHFPYIMTSGIERHVLLHSPKSDSPSAQGLNITPNDIRSLPERNSEDRRRYIRAMTRPHATLTEELEESEDELQTIALFDQYAFNSTESVAAYASLTVGFFDKKEALIRSQRNNLFQILILILILMKDKTPAWWKTSCRWKFIRSPNIDTSGSV